MRAYSAPPVWWATDMEEIIGTDAARLEESIRAARNADERVMHTGRGLSGNKIKPRHRHYPFPRKSKTSGRGTASIFSVIR